MRKYFAQMHGTTVLCVRRDNKVVITADGQVTMGEHVMKHTARKTRRLFSDKILAGFAGCAWVVWDWVASGFGPLHEIRAVLFWSMWLFIGIQVTFASFFLSMLGISRGTYIGDYDLK